MRYTNRRLLYFTLLYRTPACELCVIKHGTSSARARVACRLYTPAVEFMNLTFYGVVDRIYQSWSNGFSCTEYWWKQSLELLIYFRKYLDIVIFVYSIGRVIHMGEVNADMSATYGPFSWTIFIPSWVYLCILVFIVVDFRVCLLLLYGIRAVYRVVVAIAEVILMCKHCWCWYFISWCIG